MAIETFSSNVFAISTRNLLRHALTGPVAKTEQVGFEAEHLRDGRSWLPFRFEAVGDDYIDFDLRSYYESFESAFVGGFPVAAGATWSKSGSATLTRNTTTPDVGAACLEVAGGSAAVGMADFTDLPAGHWWRITLRARGGTSGSWRVRMQDLMTRKWFHKNSGLWTTDSASYVGVGSNTTSYANVDVQFQLEPSSTVGAATTKIRLYFDGNATTPAPLFDEIMMWPGVSFMAIIGHNVPPSGVSFDLLGGNSSPADTSLFGAAVTLPTCFGAKPDGGGGIETFYYRHYRISLPNPPLQDPAAIGIAWLGQVPYILPDQPYYPITVDTTIPQVRSGAFGAESQAALRGDMRVRSLVLRMTSSSMANASTLERAFHDSRYGADRIVVVAPYRNINTAMYGRFDPDVTETQVGLNAVEVQARFNEEPFFRLMPRSTT